MGGKGKEVDRREGRIKWEEERGGREKEMDG